jgi:pyrimidine-nucleoside phosphorylase
MTTKFIPQELIRKKRDGLSLADDELKHFFGAYVRDELPDYQASAMLMAMFLRGLNRDETVALTKISRDSGEVLQWPFPTQRIIDKHSTGGIGDKTSLVLMPLCLLEGLKVPMISGRGLGHTGGTLDKLEAIPGMNPKPDLQTARRLMSEYGGVFMGQTEQIASLDRKLYALRDVTATVECQPLIVASILSKKLAEGLGGLVLDVKYGSGAFIADQASSRVLAQQLVDVAKGCGLPARALHTNMGSPLGDRAGNALEIMETVDVLKGGGPNDTRFLSLELAAHMIQMAEPKRSLAEIRTTLESHLNSGRAFDMFCRLISAQGGDAATLEHPEKLPAARHCVEVRSAARGVVEQIDVRGLGMAIVEMGGGRRRAEDKIDPAVGLSSLKKVGDNLEAGEPLCKVHVNRREDVESITKLIGECFRIGPGPVQFELISEVIE